MQAVHPLYRPWRAWSIAAMLAFMMLVNFLDKIVLGLVSVPMMKELHLSPTQFGLIGGSLGWLFSISAVVGGLLADRKSTKWLLFWMAVMWATLQLPMIIAHSIWAIIACRVLLGMGEGPASPVAIHAIYKWFPDSKRNLPTAVLFQGSVLGLLVGGLTIPVITAHWGWRASFLALAVLGFAWCLLWLFFSEEGPITTPVEKGSNAWIPYGSLLSDPTVLGVYLGHFAANGVGALVLTWLPAYLQLGLGYKPHVAGQVFALFVAAMVPISLFLSWASQRFLTRGIPSRVSRGIFISCALIAAGAMLMALSLPGLSAVEKSLCLVIAVGTTIVMYSVGPAMLGEVTPDSQRGGILALSNGFSSLAGMASPVITGMLIEQAGGSTRHGFEMTCLACGVLLIVCGGLCVFMLDPQRSKLRLSGKIYNRVPTVTATFQGSK